MKNGTHVVGISFKKPTQIAAHPRMCQNVSTPRGGEYSNLKHIIKKSLEESSISSYFTNAVKKL